VFGGVEEPDGADDVVAGFDQVIPLEAGQLAQARKQVVLGLLDKLVGTNAILVARCRGSLAVAIVVALMGQRRASRRPLAVLGGV
jgi:hypothetical protein